jgi:hypothetical protein
MKPSILTLLSFFFASSVYAQDVSYNTVTTTTMDSNNPTSIRILGQNDPVGLASSRKISFEFSSAGKAQISAYRENSWGTSLQFLTSDDSDLGGNPSVRLHIHRTGNIGIGTTIPGNKLTVLMDASTNGDGVAVQAASNMGAGSQPGYALLNSSGNKRMYSYLDVFTDTYNIGNASGTNLMSINQNGNVGIGAIDARGYKLAVNGKIRAQEIKVEASPWPDCVFNKSYSLPTLQETEKHIKEKGHLPGMPSAEEVKTNGIDLGEMNAKLLQKIEELTLHLIEIKKENQEIKDQVKKLLNK